MRFVLALRALSVADDTRFHIALWQACWEALWAWWCRRALPRLSVAPSRHCGASRVAQDPRVACIVTSLWREEPSVSRRALTTAGARGAACLSGGQVGLLSPWRFFYGWQETVIEIITKPPVNHILHVSSYTPSMAEAI